MTLVYLIYVFEERKTDIQAQYNSKGKYAENNISAVGRYYA